MSAYDRASRDRDEPVEPLLNSVHKYSAQAKANAAACATPLVDDYLDNDGVPRVLHSVALRATVVAHTAAVRRLELTASRSPAPRFSFASPDEGAFTPPVSLAASGHFATPHGSISTRLEVRNPSANKTIFGGDTDITTELQRLAAGSAIRQAVFFVGPYDPLFPRSTVFEDSHRK